MAHTQERLLLGDWDRSGSLLTGAPGPQILFDIQQLCFCFLLGKKTYCISAFMSQEWIEFVPFSANNNRQSGNLVENK